VWSGVQCGVCGVRRVEWRAPRATEGGRAVLRYDLVIQDDVNHSVQRHAPKHFQEPAHAARPARVSAP
jgi:hypothetical protein